MAMNTHRQLQINNSQSAKSLEKLSSGYRINRAGDDAAGLAISEKMRGQINGLSQASRNAQDGISLIQTAEGALNETHDILQRMRELAVQAGNDTQTQSDRGQIQKEMDELAKEITRITNTTEFNTKNLLSGAYSDQSLQIGANANQNLSFSIGAMDAFTLGVTSDIAGAVSVTDVDAGITAAAVQADSVAATVTGNVSINSAVVETAATLTGTVNLTGTEKLTDLGVTAGAGVAFTVSISNDGGAPANYTVTLDTTAGTGADRDMTVNQFITALDTALGANGNAELSGGRIVITSAGVGDDSTVTIAAGSDDTFQGALGVSEGVAETGTTTLTVTATQGSLSSQVTGVAKDATSVSFTTGDLAGLSLTKSAADIDGGSATVSIAVGTASAAAVTDGAGNVTTGATVAKGISIMTQTRANNAITVINDAITKVSTERATLGAIQNRLEHTIKNLDTSSENLQASESRIRDVDMAAEMMEYTKQNILQQAATAMLAQANQAPQAVLQLLQ